MLSIKTLCSLLFIVLLFSPSQADWYRKDELDITPQLIEDPEPRTSSDYKPINITFDHSSKPPSFMPIVTLLRCQYRRFGIEHQFQLSQ